MSHTRSRVIQYLGLFVVFGGIAISYWYFSVRAGGRLNAPQTGTLTSGLVGYWTFDGADISGTTATDKSTTGANGTLTNGPAKVAGKVGQALSFWPDGVDTQAYVHIGDPAGGQLDFGSGDFSVGFWMKTSGYVDQSSSVNVPLSKTAVGTGNAAGYYFQYGSSNQLQFVVRNGSSTYALATPTSIVGDWHYYMGVRSGSTMYFYQDGVSVGSTAVSGSTSNSEFFQVGSYGAGGPYFNVNGSMDEVRVYNRALAATEIQSLYDLGSSDKINSSISQKQGGGTLANGLAGYWKFDEGTGTSAADASTNANTGTLQGSPIWQSSGKIGTAVTFDGSNDEITTTTNIGDGSSFKMFTLSTWFKTSTASGRKIIGLESNQTGTGSIYYDRDIYIGTDGKVYFRVYDGVSKYATSPSTFNDGNWHHAVGVSNGDNKTIQLYVDGVLQQTTAIGTVYSSYPSSYWRIGGYKVTGLTNNGGDGFFTGDIDEVRVYNRTLSTDEISQLYRLTTPTVVDTSLKGYWSFDGEDVSGTTAFDRSGAGNNGTLTNGPAVTPGAVGQALNFDGTDDYVSVPDADVHSPSVNNMTISTWAKKSGSVSSQTCGTNSGYYLVMKGATSPGWEWALQQMSDSAICFISWTSGGSTIASVTLSRTINDGQWHLYTVAIQTGTRIDFYVDGVLSGSTTSFSGSMSNTTSAITIGARDNGSTGRFGGILDEVRINNRVLSVSEIQSLYASGQSDKVNSAASTPQGVGRLDSGLAGYWRFDDGSGSSATDSSTNGTTLTLTNSPSWSTGKMGTSLTFFPGGSDTNAIASVTDPASGVLDFGSGDFSVAFWAKGRGYTAQGSSGNMLVGKKNVDSSSAAGWYFGINSSSIPQMNVNNGSTEIYPGGGTALSDDAWHHLVGLRAGSTVKLYSDGVLVSSGTLAGNVSNVNSFWVGDDGTGLRNFKGEIDEVRTYNRALSEDEISQLYRIGTPTGTDTSLKGYWSFNGQDVSGTTAYDRSGAGNNGTLTNGPAVTPGKLGQALSFDGSNDYISVPQNGNFNLSSSGFTIALWINKTADGRVISWYDGSKNIQLIASTRDGGVTQMFALKNHAGTFAPQAATASVAIGQWHHVAGTFNGSSYVMYVDGVTSSGSLDGIPSAYTTESTNLYIGQFGGSFGFFSGKLDEVRIYNRALGASEIAALYNQSR